MYYVWQSNQLMLSPADYAVSVYFVGLTSNRSFRCFCISQNKLISIVAACFNALYTTLHHHILCSLTEIHKSFSFNFYVQNRYQQNYIAVRLGRNQRLRRGQKLDRKTWICIIEYTVKRKSGQVEEKKTKSRTSNQTLIAETR